MNQVVHTVVFVAPALWTAFIKAKYLVNSSSSALLEHHGDSSFGVDLLVVGRVVQLFVPFVAFTLTSILTAICTCARAVSLGLDRVLFNVIIEDLILISVL